MDHRERKKEKGIFYIDKNSGREVEEIKYSRETRILISFWLELVRARPTCEMA